MAEVEAIGKILDGRYKIVRQLAEGAFGQTFVAEDLKRPNHPLCAIKKLQPKQSHPDFLAKATELFDREAEALELLGEHRQIPRLLAHLEIDREFYLVEEYIVGQTLDAELKSQGNLSQAQAIELVLELSSIVAFVHQHNIIHRDIKPGNIIRREADNKLVLIDFGAVTVFNGETLFGTIIVTPGYAAPEQCEGEAGFYSDIHAIGIVAIQALTGINPCLLERDVDDEIILSDRLDLNPDFQGILTKMVRLNKRDRYADTSSVIEDLKRLNGNVETVPSTLITKELKKANRGRQKLIAAGVAVLAVPLGWWLIGIFKSEPDLIPVNGKAIEAELTAEQPCLDLIMEQDIYCQEYRFMGSKDSQVTIEMNSDSFDPQLVLQQPDGKKLVVNGDRSINNWNARIQADLPKEGEYKIIARTTSPGESGKYTLRARLTK